MKIDAPKLKYLQSLSLTEKIELSKCAINEWYEYWDGKVYVSFSGGKDSTVLLHLVRSEFPHVKGMFINTGIEHPANVSFVKKNDNIDIIHPQLTFPQIINQYGYPVVSKETSDCIYKLTHCNLSENYRNNRLKKLPARWHYLLNAPFKISDLCCQYLKKRPAWRYHKQTGAVPFIGSMASESWKRRSDYKTYGCNAFDKKHPSSTPLGIWTDIDIWQYIKLYNLQYSPIYDKGYDRTGCLLCLFGIHLEKTPNRIQKMAIYYPKIYHYCMNNLKYREVLDYMNIPYIGNQKRKAFFF